MDEQVTSSPLTVHAAVGTGDQGTRFRSGFGYGF
jgi:hypothetical protein